MKFAIWFSIEQFHPSLKTLKDAIIRHMIKTIEEYFDEIDRKQLWSYNTKHFVSLFFIHGFHLRLTHMSLSTSSVKSTNTFHSI